MRSLVEVLLVLVILWAASFFAVIAVKFLYS